MVDGSSQGTVSRDGEEGAVAEGEGVRLDLFNGLIFESIGEQNYEHGLARYRNGHGL